MAYGAYVSIGSVSWSNQDLKEALQEFALIYEHRPIKDNFGGMRAPQMFFTWFAIKRLKPKYIIESGVYKGQSTWLLEQAAPDAQIIALDPNLRSRIYISKKVIYKKADFADIDWFFLDPEDTICFFDDHYGLERIKQCHERGFKHILYEDNYPIPGGNQFHPSGNAYAPKAAFKNDTKEAAYLYNILEVYYEFPPIIPNRDCLYKHPFYEMNSKILNYKCFSWDFYKNETPQPLYESATKEFLKIYEREAYNYNWFAYIKIR